MINPVVHIEIIGPYPEALRQFYSQAFGWESVTDQMVAPEVSAPGIYGHINRVTPEGAYGVAGGIGGGEQFKAKIIFYIGVENVELALQRVELFGGKRIMGPVTKLSGDLIVAHFLDPAGNTIGLAGPK